MLHPASEVLGILQALGLALLCCLVWLVIALSDRRKMRLAAFRQWESYLSVVKTSLHRLRVLSRALKQARKDGDGELPPPTDRIDEVVRNEIQALLLQMDNLAKSPDFSYSDAPIHWRPFPAMENEIQDLIESSLGKVLDTEVARDSGGQHMQTMRESIESLRSRNKELTELLENLAERYAEIPSRRTELSVIEPVRARGQANEEAVAARLMSELESGLAIEKIESRLTDLGEQIGAVSAEMADPSCNAARKESLRSEIDWLLQVKRWWNLQRKIRHQEELLAEASDGISKMADDAYRSRFEKWIDRQEVEQENAQLRDQLGDQIIQNRILQRHIESLTSEQAAQDILRRKLSRLIETHTMSEHNFRNLEGLAEELGERFAITRLRNKQIAQLEKRLSEAKTTERERTETIAKLEAKAREREKNFENERRQFKASIGLLENALEAASTGKSKERK